MYLVQTISISREEGMLSVFYANDPVDYETKENFEEIIKNDPEIFINENLSNEIRTIYFRIIDEQNADFLVPLEIQDIGNDYNLAVPLI